MSAFKRNVFESKIETFEIRRFVSFQRNVKMKVKIKVENRKNQREEKSGEIKEPS